MNKHLALCLALMLALTALSAPRPAAADEDRETLYQVAMLQSLAQGCFDGVTTVGALLEHGDTGIGTYDGLDGEMIVLDGVAYRAGADGSITAMPAEATVPFSNVTFFDEDLRLPLSGIADMSALQDALNTSVAEAGSNQFCVVRITGSFASLKARSEPRQEKPYRQLDEALAADQAEFDWEGVRGTMVGLYCPPYMSALNSAGWHFHFISEDRSQGGHVLRVAVAEAEAALDLTPGFRMMTPETEDFQALDLTRNIDKAIERAETAASDTEEPPMTVSDLLRDLAEARAARERIDTDLSALRESAQPDRLAVAEDIAAHWKQTYLDPYYQLLRYGHDDPAALPVTGRHAFAVLGYALVNGEMTPELKGRCEAAAAAARAFPESLLVCSGGPTGANNPALHTEAGLMRDYLVTECGIAPERILVDEKALTTAENAINTFELLRERDIHTLTVVTSTYHQLWGQAVYQAVAALYREYMGYSVEIVGNFCFDIAPENPVFEHDERIAIHQIDEILTRLTPPAEGGAAQ